MDVIYEPREDSHLLARNVRKYAKGFALDMGTGTGFLALVAAEKCSKVLAVDINFDCIEYCKNNIKDEKIEIRGSDLFSNIKERFDTIMFNPPYLPDDSDVQDIALDGGKDGHETVERFLVDAKRHLTDEGIILLLFSSLTNKGVVDNILEREGYNFRQIDSESFAFETIYVYLINHGAG